AVTLEQLAEAADQQFALAKDVAPFFQRQMQRPERLDQVAIGEGVAREVRHVANTEPFSDVVQRAAREIERAVAPAFAAPHPAAVWLLRIEHEQGGRCGVL